MILKVKKGFSLVELLVVIAIIGILAAVGITAYSGYTKNAKAKASLSQFSQVEAVVNAELARCAVGEGDMIWGTAASQPEDVMGVTPPPIEYDADECSDAFPPNHTNIVSYVNTGLPDSLGMTNPYNADEPFATVGSRDTPSAVLGGMIIFCGNDGGTNKCQLDVLHKTDTNENVEILEY